METTEVRIDPNLCCKICNENKFHLREGFYYCDECGTKQNQVRAFEVERDDDFNEKKHIKKQKIHTFKTEKPQLTSWECYNYILRGVVEDLLGLGAKQELKLMSLQVWAAYLKRNEVAFFNKKHAELPKLGVRFLKRDSMTLYNHCQQLKKKHRIRRTENGSSGPESSIREWRKNKRKLDESEYSNLSASPSLLSKESGSLYSSNTSSTGGTTRAIQLKFSLLARKQYKKVMPLKHLQKHEKDSEGLLKCHKICPKVRTLNRNQHAVTCLNMKQIYTIVAIALNLVEDEIQMSDLVRFINEERINAHNVHIYFPENVVPHCKDLLKEIGFTTNSIKYTYKALREQISVLSKFLHINEFHKPDIYKLVQRYVTDLNLPDEVVLFIGRLITLLPPDNMKPRAPFSYPAYEARAMAYIIFVLKLLFGLDGHSEHLMSDSAKKLNLEMDKLKTLTDSLQPLFVWNEWMEYVEMRKVIVSQYNRNFCRQFNQCQNTAQLLLEIAEEHQQESVEAPAMEKKIDRSNKTSVANMKRIFEIFLRNYHKTPPEPVDAIFFPPSYTPAHSYFKRILLHISSDQRANSSPIDTIPEFMRIDHTQRSVRLYLQPKPLHDFFCSKGLHLKITKVPCTSKRCYVGIFRPQSDKNQSTSLKADFNISDEKWLDQIQDDAEVDELKFKTELESYRNHYFDKIGFGTKNTKISTKKMLPKSTPRKKHFKNSGADITASDFLLPSTEFRQKLNANKVGIRDNIHSIHSINVFNECDMEPITNLNLTTPRRCYDSGHLFEDVSDVETNDDNTTTLKEKLNINKSKSITSSFITSGLDYWVLIGNIHLLNEAQKKSLENKFSRSFFWLLETCAQTIDVDWSQIYEQLLVIEFMFIYGIESLEELEGFIKLKLKVQIKDINHLILLFREMW